MPKQPKNTPKDGQQCDVHCSWSSSDDAILVLTLHVQKESGNQSGDGWKPQVWHLVSDAIIKSGTSKGAPKVAKKCADHWANLKKNFLEVSAIHYQSGFGWDEGLQLCTATACVWEQYIEAHLSAARWRTVPFPLFNDISYLVNSIVTTGEGVFHSGRDVSPTETVSSVSASQPLRPEPSSTNMIQSSSPKPSFLHDSIANDIMDSDDLKEVIPAVSHKRTRADSEPSSPLLSASNSDQDKGKRKGCKHRKTQVQDNSQNDALAVAILQLSKNMNSNQGMPTPERCGRAIDLVTDDDAFSLNGEGDLLEIFAENVAYADTYIATKKRDARVLFGN